jgi:ketosteroid isomerase-like protein
VKEVVPVADTGKVTVETLRRLLDAFNAHDLDAVMSFFTDDCVLETPRGEHPWGTRFKGREAVREGLSQRFRGLPDVHYAEDEHWVCGEHGVSRWLLTGTTTGGEPVRVRGCDLFDLTADGRVRRKDSYWKIVQQ